MPVHLVDHPLVHDALLELRDKHTPPASFRRAAARITALLACEAMRDVPSRDALVETPLGTARARRIAGEIVLVTLQPCSDAEAGEEYARRMAALSPDLVVMDCMSYTRANKVRVRLSYGGPVILAIAAAARAVEELVA